MSENILKYNQKDFNDIIEIIAKINNKIGKFESAVQNNELSYLIVLTNGRIIIPEEVMMDKNVIMEDDSRIRMIAESFMPSDIVPANMSLKSDVSIQSNKIRKRVNINNKYYLIIILFIIICITSYYFFTQKNHYDRGVKLLREKKYELALLEFQKVDSLNKDYKYSISKINYAMGMLELSKKEYLNALKYIELTDENDEFAQEVKEIKSNLNKNPVVVYDCGMKYIKLKNYDSAMIKFMEIGTSDTLYLNTSFKIKYLNAIKKMNEGKYALAEKYLKDFDLNDELIMDVNQLIGEINNQKDYEENNKYAKFLLDMYDKLTSFYSRYYGTPSRPSLQETFNIDYELNSMIKKITSYKYNAINKDDLLLNLNDALTSTMNLILQRIYNYENYLKGIIAQANYTYIRDNLVLKIDLGFSDCGRARWNVSGKYRY